LLALMPFWDPLIPPMGISCLKSFLNRYGFSVKTADANTGKDFRTINDTYFETLKESIPAEKRSNFYNIAGEVLRSHLLAHLHRQDEKSYADAIKDVIFKHFYFKVGDNDVDRLNRIIQRFYEQLEAYVIELLERERPGIFGLSVFGGTVAASMFAFKLAKKHDPGIRTVMGGGIFSDQLAPDTPNFRHFLEKTPYIDTFITCEGEILFLKYLRGELPGTQKVFTLKDIPAEPLDISSLPTPDFSGLEVEYYPNLAVYTSRGCPYTCQFCSETLRWGKYRKKNAARVREEMMNLYRQYDSQLFLLTDSLLNPIAGDLAAALRENSIPFYWDCYLRVDRQTCDSSTVTGWRRGGLYRARLGVESGSQKVLDLMNKKISIQQVKDTLYNLAAAGIKTTTYWVIGYPGESGEDFQQTLELITGLANEIYEAEYSSFTYFYSGQVNSNQWAQKRFPLYPEETGDMLVIRSWDLLEEPSREERFRRVNRFKEHCRTLGIPNPYSLYDINKADNRWKKLHKNAVPAAAEFRDSGTIIQECRQVKQQNIAQFDECKIEFNFQGEKT